MQMPLCKSAQVNVSLVTWPLATQSSTAECRVLDFTVLEVQKLCGFRAVLFMLFQYVLCISKVSIKQCF